MATQPNRATVILNEDTMALLRELQERTGMSPAQTIQKLIPAHLEELTEYLEWLKQQDSADDKNLKRKLGPLLLQNYGPDSLVEAIKQLDPDYETNSEKFRKTIKG